MPEYRLVEPFDIDGDELAGLTSPVIFVLGFEFCGFLAALNADPSPFTMMIHTANAERCVNACARRKRAAHVTWVHDDYEEWRTVQVGANP